MQPPSLCPGSFWVGAIFRKKLHSLSVAPEPLAFACKSWRVQIPVFKKFWDYVSRSLVLSPSSFLLKKKSVEKVLMRRRRSSLEFLVLFFPFVFDSEPPGVVEMSAGFPGLVLINL